MKRNMLSALLLASGAALTAAYLHQKRRGFYSFNHRVVVITGGSRGLGLALARKFADEGSHVALLARDWEELERAQRDLIERGAQQPMIVQCDVRDNTSVQSAIELVQREFNRIDVLINCAGIVRLAIMRTQPWCLFYNPAGQ